MQDLEELRVRIKVDDNYGEIKFLELDEALSLIDRLQAAEKEIDSLKERNEVKNDALLDAEAREIKLNAELKALREQKPVAYADPQAFINFESEKINKEFMWRYPDPSLVPIYLAPVPQSRAVVMICDECFQEGVLRSVPEDQSRDSAEPIITDHQGRPMTYWGGKSNQDPVALSRDGAEPVADDPLLKTYSLGVDDALMACISYVTHGAANFSGLNLKLAETFKERVKSSGAGEAKQAVPDALEFTIVSHLATENTLHEGYVNGWNDCRNAMLAAAQQVSAEQPDVSTNKEYAIGFKDGFKAGQEGDDVLLAHVLITSDCVQPEGAAPEQANVLQLAIDQPWSMYHCVQKLINAAEILLYEKGFDGHGHELIREAKICADKYLREFKQSPAPKAKE